jgi:hypothetical protein
VTEPVDPRNDEPTGPEYDRLALLARVTRPQAPPDFTDRVMRAVRLSRAPVSARSNWLGRLGDVLFRAPALAGILSLAVLALIVASVVLRPETPRSEKSVSPEMVLHRFEFVAPDARKVCLVGDFNAWELCRLPLVKNEQTGAWTVEIPLPPGRHEYMFVVDERSWVTDPEAPNRVDDGFGNQNAVVFL